MRFEPKPIVSSGNGKLLAAAFAAATMVTVAVSVPAFAQATKGGASDMKGMPGMGGASPATEKPAGTGTVNSVDQGQRKVNLSHDPIPAIKWPAMKMDFPVAASVDLSRLKPGTKVRFTLAQGPGGTYTIDFIDPAAR